MKLFKQKKYKKPSGRSIGRRYTGGSGIFKRRQYFWQRRSFKIYCILITLVLFFILYLLLWSGIFKIQNIKIEGAVTIDSAQIQEIIEKQLTKRRFGLFKQSNLLFFSPKMAAKEVKTSFVIESIKIKKRPLKTLKIELLEKSNKITWITDNRYYYLDPNGLVVKEILVASVTLVQGSVAENDEAGGEAMIDLSALDSELPKVYDLSNAEVKIGEKAVEPIVIEFIIQLNNKLPKPELNINSFQIPEPKGTEVRVVTDRGFDVYFDAQDDIDRQLANLNLIIRKKLENNNKNINYIDLRFGDRVYIK